MERRKAKRFPVEGEVKGRVVLASNCDIRDISASGMRFLLRRRILPGSRVCLDLGRDGRSLNIHARVVRSRIVSTGTSHDDDGPLYEVAVLFDPLENTDQEALAELIAQVG
jgi:hypothetical protein